MFVKVVLKTFLIIISFLLILNNNKMSILFIEIKCYIKINIKGVLNRKIILKVSQNLFKLTLAIIINCNLRKKCREN